MHPLPDCRPVTAADLPAEALRLAEGGWRFITASCVPRPAGWTVLYHFEQAEQLRHLRVELAAGETVPAIDEAYPAAFLVENEMKELQDLPVSGLSVDYEGRLYRDFDAPEGWVHVHAPGEGETVTAQPGDGNGRVR